MSSKGPLAGVRVLEIAGIGPGPFATMLLSDLGADVIRLDRKGVKSTNFTADTPYDATARGRRSIALNLKEPGAKDIALALIEKSDALVEGFRPGVMERLGLGPEAAWARNPRLVYARMTGWGQDGPYAQMAGHDINYIAISGVLHAIGLKDRPVPPLNLVGDYVGALVLVIGTIAAVLSARTSGKGQVVDTSMSDAAAYMLTTFQAMMQGGMWNDRREANSVDGGCPYYGAYRCSDGEWISIGSMEPQFYALLIEKTGLPAKFAKLQHDQASWPDLRKHLTDAFASKTRAQWCAIMEGTDVCFAPVLSMTEAHTHPQNTARGLFVKVAGVVQPGPVPRFSDTTCAVQGPPPKTGEHSLEILRELGFDKDRIATLQKAGAV